jgi:tetratricopeptide (TPR) repeat protein
MDMLTANLEEMPKRHHSLRAVMDDSWNALTDEECRLFRRLSVFRGGFDLSAAEQIAGATLPGLAGLVSKSWLQREVSGRYQAHELLRQYGVERLNSQPDEELAARNGHARYYSEFLLKREQSLTDRKSMSLLHEIDLEVNNLRVAWGWHLASQQVDFIASHVQGLWKYYNHKGWFEEAASMLEQASGLNDVPAVQRGRWQLWRGEAYYQMGRIAQSEECLTQALTLLGERVSTSQNTWGRTLLQQVLLQTLHSIWPSRFVRRNIPDRQRLLDAAAALSRIGPIAYQSGDGLRTLAAAFWDLNLAELAGSPPDLARSYTGCCITLGSLPIHSLAEYYGRKALQTAQSSVDPGSRAYVLEITALYRSGLGRWMDAKAMLEESAALYDQLVLPRGQIESRSLLAKVHYHQGQFVQAQNLYQEALTISQQQGDFTGEHWSLMGLVECTLCLGQPLTDTTMTQLARANSLQTKVMIGRADMIRYFGVLAQVQLHRGEYNQALEAAQTGLRLIRQKPFAGLWTMDGYAGVAETFLSLLERGKAKHELLTEQAMLKAHAWKAWQAMQAFSRIFPIAQSRTSLYQGWYDWITDKRSQANRAWQKGLRRAERFGLPYEQARTHHEIGRHQGDAADGKAHLQRANAIYAELGISVEAFEPQT